MPRESLPPAGQENQPNQKAAMSRRGFLKLAGKAALGAAVAGGVFQKLEKVAEAVGGRENSETVEEWYRDWEALKKVTEEGGVKENIRRIKNVFGGAADRVIFKPLSDLRLVEFGAAAERDGKDLRKTGEGLDFLRQISKTYRLFWSRKHIEERLHEREIKEGLDAFLEGFENLPGFSNDKVKKLLEGNLNRRWLYGNVSAFRYINRPQRRAHYEIAGSAEIKGIQSMLYKSKQQDVVMYSHPLNSPAMLVMLLAHEVGHHQDWENNNRLPIHERLQFLLEVVDQFARENRTKTSYIDLDIPREYAEKKSEPGEMLYRQLQEYWATIVSAYSVFANTPSVLRTMQEKNPDEYALVEKWYKRLAEEYAVAKK